jgi:cell division transport system ATP-binding protein
MIRLDNVSARFGSVPVFENLSLHVVPGEFVCLVGRTGSGKTTLMRLLCFDLRPASGEVIVNGMFSSLARKRDVPRLRRSLGIVFQDFKLLEERNVYENVAFALEVTGARREEIGKRVLRVLADVGLSHKRNSRPEELSGGEQQRVGIARALVNSPVILLADEPTGNLDAATSLEILQLLKDINARGTAVLLSTHNEEVVRKSGARILRLSDGKLTEERAAPPGPAAARRPPY